MDGEASGVRKDFAQRDHFLGGERIVRNLPRSQELVEIVVQRELALLHQTHRRQGRDGLAYRPSLESRQIGDGLAACFRYSNAQPPNLLLLHAFFYRRARLTVVF